MEDFKKEYYFEGNDIGCLLIHGFTATPAELRELGEHLNKNGFTVLGVRLKGHGTTIEEMEKCSYEDWIHSVEEGYKRLKKNCKTIYVIGHSMGSLLSLYCAENYEVSKVIALSPPFIVKDKRANFAFIARYFMKYDEWSKRDRSEEENKYLLGYKKIPVCSVHEFNKLRKVVTKNLNKIDIPMLVIHSYLDEVVANESIDFLLDKTNPKDRKVVYLKKSGHNITIECEKDVVFEEVLRFIVD